MERRVKISIVRWKCRRNEREGEGMSHFLSGKILHVKRREQGVAESPMVDIHAGIVSLAGRLVSTI